MIQRFELTEEPSKCVRKNGWQPPPSVAFERLVWRDVSRSSQKRRIIATIVPPGYVAGNSLGVAHFRDADPQKLRVLLGLVSSLVFEAQLRALLATGHVSLASLRMVHLPWPESSDSWGERLSELVDRRLIGEVDVEAEIEALVATAYGLDIEETKRIVHCFPRLTEEERTRILELFGLDGVLAA
jgi:Alw26I/Eco31I/Esp3I family type II restriction m6 adenine DNA methyltransferase